MKNFKRYAPIAILVGASIISAGNCSRKYKIYKEQEAEARRIEVERQIAATTEEVISSIEKLINDQIERELEEQAAFEKAVTNSDFIDTPEFALTKRVTVTWNSARKTYIVECANDDITYTVDLPEERLIRYMLKKCNCEYLFFHGLENTEILKELSLLSNIKELSIYDSKIEDLEILKKYQSLIGVRLENCPNISDISFFEELPDIVAVEIIGTKVSDVSPLSNAQNLVSANLRCNEITNPETISDLENLTALRLDYNKIENVSQLRAFIERGIMSEDLANQIVETTSNHALVFSTTEEKRAVSLEITYYEAQKEYYAEAKDAEGNTVAYLFTDEPYNFYDLSLKLGEQRYLYINNFPEDGYFHHLNNSKKFEYVTINNCQFSKFYIPGDVVSLSVFNCPNLTDTLKVSGDSKKRIDLKYISIKGTGITSVEGFDLARDLEYVILEDNKIENYDFLLDAKNLKNVSVTIDSLNTDKSVFEELNEKEVEVNILYDVLSKEEEEKIPMGIEKAR